MTGKPYLEEIAEQAALFALGVLEPEDAKRFQRRVDAECPLCVSELRECQSALTALSLSARPVAPPAGLRARLLDRVREDSEVGSQTQGSIVRAQESAWKAAAFPGVEMRYLHERKTMLVRMAPKSRIPAHPHASAEQCLVLEGSVASDGITANAGDFIYMPAGSSHDDLFSENGALFLIAYT